MNCWPIQAHVMVALAQASGHLFREGSSGRILIGKDTRLSSYMLENALVSGFVSVGMEVLLLGPIPTPALSMLTRSLRANLGVMISASHNPHWDNGVKIFNKEGRKLDVSAQNQLADLMEEIYSSRKQVVVSPERTGKVKRLGDAKGRYIEFLKAEVPKEAGLRGQKVVLDCANGAAYRVGGDLFWELGADVITIGCNPNGKNINLGYGSMDRKKLSQEVRKHKASIGIALDGDGDRAMFCDEKGQEVPGEKVLGLLAKDALKHQGLQGIVLTQGVNKGLLRYLEKEGIEVVLCPTGDRHVMSSMKEKGYPLGGEASGHILLGHTDSTGDGLKTAIAVMMSLIRLGIKKSSQGFNLFPLLPQGCVSVPLKGEKEARFLKKGALFDMISAKRAQLEADGGELFIRLSGTEPVIRISAQGETASLVQSVLEEVRKRLEERAC